MVRIKEESFSLKDPPVYYGYGRRMILESPKVLVEVPIYPATWTRLHRQNCWNFIGNLSKDLITSKRCKWLVKQFEFQKRVKTSQEWITL